MALIRWSRLAVANQKEIMVTRDANLYLRSLPVERRACAAAASATSLRYVACL